MASLDSKCSFDSVGGLSLHLVAYRALDWMQSNWIDWEPHLFGMWG